MKLRLQKKPPNNDGLIQLVIINSYWFIYMNQFMVVSKDNKFIVI